MLYIVSGYRRSGTSAMMRALQAGLKEGAVAYQPAQERIGARVNNGYVANPSGLLEVGQFWYMKPSFLRGVPDNTLLKILYDGLPHIPRGNWTIFFMHRDPDEIRASCERVDQHLRSTGVPENPEKGYPFDSFRPYNQEDIDHVIDIMEVRADVRLVHVLFREMIESPLETFERLAEYIPIDPQKAAEIIRPEYYRFRGSNEYKSKEMLKV